MTDKVQKIRKDVEKLKDELNSPDASSYTEAYIIGATHTINSVLDIIDTLQEEPVSNNYSALLPCIYNRTLEERVKCCKYCSAACEGRVKQPVSEELQEASEKCIKELIPEAELNSATIFALEYVVQLLHETFKAGAKWQKENLWNPADGDDLPEYEREVVVFTQNYPDDAGIMSVAIGHRPNPDGWDGKSLATGEVEHYTPKTYGKGGWNIPNVVLWLDAKLPKEIEL